MSLSLGEIKNELSYCDIEKKLKVIRNSTFNLSYAGTAFEEEHIAKFLSTLAGLVEQPLSISL